MPELIDEVAGRGGAAHRPQEADDHNPGGEPTAAGCATDRQKVKQLGGQLTVRSALGEGATFTLTLPRRPRDDR